MTTTSTLTLPVLPLPDGVILPDMIVTIGVQSDEAAVTLAAADGGQFLIVPRIAGRFSSVGVTATVVDSAPAPASDEGQPATVTIRAEQRARIGSGVPTDSGVLRVEVELVDEPAESADTARLAAEYRATAGALLEKVGGPRSAGLLRNLTGPAALADSIAYWPDLTLERRVQLLETIDVTQRLELALDWVRGYLAEAEVAEKIQKGVSDDLSKAQRDAILRRQLAAIRSELGEGDGDEGAVGDYRNRLDALLGAVPPAIDESPATAIAREIDRLERSGGESMESNWIRTWLDTVFELPWGERSDDRIDLVEARDILDADHTGLDEVKDRLVEHLAVRKLRAERGTLDDGGRRGVILALAGPPGVGKTSLGESIARTLGRSFVRLALGGIRDEAEIRGHRRTYVGARPGRLVRSLIEAGSMNPVILLDEIDKIAGGWQGDPSAALLEVLDPAQNHSFRDHYLEFELDLSDIVFVATANVVDTIPAPLLDRLEIITLDGYTEAEKAAIARDHLLPRLVVANGLRATDVEITDGAIDAIAAHYTREAGVRHLERLLDKVLRRVAREIAEHSDSDSDSGSGSDSDSDSGSDDRPVIVGVDELREYLGRPVPQDEIADRIDRPGIATGLAVTGAGGEVLFVETALIDGEGDTVLTGQLGDVMKESATIVRSLVASHAERFGIEIPAGQRFHVHFPAGAVPKDGPSAGVTMTTAVVSLLSGRRVRPDVAMTGEVALGGKVLPIGGVKQKVLAAHRAGITTVILPSANGPDVEDIPERVREQMEIHLVDDVHDLVGLALETPATE